MSDHVDEAKKAAARERSRVLKALRTQDGPVGVRLDPRYAEMEPYLDTLLGELAIKLMKQGGRRLAVAQAKRLEMPDGEPLPPAAIDALVRASNYSVVLGALAAPLAEQIGVRRDVLKHEQKLADALTLLKVAGICNEAEVEKMNRRLVKRINESVMKDAQPQRPARIPISRPRARRGA